MPNYRVPRTDEVRSVPESMPLSEREVAILDYDIRVSEEGIDEPYHWQTVADRMREELGIDQTKYAVMGVKRRFMTKLRRFALKQVVNATIEDNIIPRDRPITVDQRKLAMQRLLETTYESVKSPENDSKKRRVLIVSDYHGTVHPFIAESLLSEQYDLCVHAGDILDQWSLHTARIEGKSLTRQEKETFLDEELQTMRAWLELLDEQTDAQHIVLAGNHDVRVETIFVRLLAPYLKKESLLVRMFRTPLELLVEGLENVTLGNREMIWRYPDGSEQHAADTKFLYQMGDAIVSHMNFTGKQPGTAVNRLWTWIQEYRHSLGLSNIRACFQAHTHSLLLDKNCQGGHVNLVETGSAMEATALGYGLVYNGNWTPSAVGYVTFDQDLKNGEWTTDLSSIQLHGVE